MWLFQVSSSSVRSNPLGAEENIIERSCISKSNIDRAFCSPDARLLLSMIEVRPFDGKWKNQETQGVIKQTISFSIVPGIQCVGGASAPEGSRIGFSSCL